MNSPRDRAKILIVDDIPANIGLLRNMLEPEGYRLAFATTGERALRIAPVFQPDLVLLDVILSGMDGFETCMRLKAMETLRDVPVIFVTAKTGMEDLLQAYEVGGVDYIAKPVGKAELRARVATHLQLRALIKQHQAQLQELEALTRELRRSEQRFRDFAESASDWFWEMDADLRYIYFSERFLEITSMRKEEVLGMTWFELAAPEQIAQDPEKWWKHEEDFKNRRSFRDFKYIINAKNGHRTYARISGKPVFDEDGTFLGYRGAGTDITAQREAEEELHRLATTDSLTGVFNRRYFLDLANREFERSRRYQRPISVIMLDADHFKRINDTYGHDIGDEVLRQLAGTCQSYLREHDILGRLGGEELAIVLPETEWPGAEEVAERLRRAIAGLQIECNDETLSFTVSMGVAMLNKDDPNFAALLKRADEALYDAKEAGRNRVVCASGS